jgi:hypothetical protein
VVADAGMISEANPPANQKRSPRRHRLHMGVHGDDQQPKRPRALPTPKDPRRPTCRRTSAPVQPDARPAVSLSTDRSELRQQPGISGCSIDGCLTSRTIGGLCQVPGVQSVVWFETCGVRHNAGPVAHDLASVNKAPASLRRVTRRRISAGQRTSTQPQGMKVRQDKPVRNTAAVPSE